MNRMLILAVTLLLVNRMSYAADGTDEPDDQVDDRWYTETQLGLGKTVFDNHCAVCHGTDGQGLADDWKKPLADSSYPPPALNGSAHTWHHPISILMRTINNGGMPLGGKMPTFAEKLSIAEKTAVITHFQHTWPEVIYEAWVQRGGLTN